MATNIVTESQVHVPEQPPVDDPIPREITYTKNNYVNKYELIGFFGMGRFGNCYKYEDTNTNIRYAVKAIHKTRDVGVQNGTIAKKNETTRIQQAFEEAAIQKPLRHQNVVRLYWAFDDESYVYLFLEPCIHGSLDDVIKNRGRLSVIESRYYIRHLTLGCKYLRQNLVIHRDLKPKNLFIDSNMRLKIGDFGLALKPKRLDEKFYSLCGTPNYMAPEIFAEEGHSFEVDMWAVGCILYELMVGQPPFLSENYESTVNAILEVAVNDIPGSVYIPETALVLMIKLLHRKPNKRYTPTEVLQSVFFQKKGQILPRQLPEILLSPLPSLAVFEEGAGAELPLNLDEIVSSIIAESREPNFAETSLPFDVKVSVQEPATPRPSDNELGIKTSVHYVHVPSAVDEPGPSGYTDRLSDLEEPGPSDYTDRLLDLDEPGHSRYGAGREPRVMFISGSYNDSDEELQYRARPCMVVIRAILNLISRLFRRHRLPLMVARYFSRTVEKFLN